MTTGRRFDHGTPKGLVQRTRISRDIADHASSNVIVLDQPAFASGGATPFDFGAKPLIVLYRTGQQVERHLVGRAATLRREPG